MAELGFDILLRDESCLAVNKPAGLPTQAPPGIDSLEVRIRAMLSAEQGMLPGEVYLGVPHRLDRPASGAILFALTLRAARRISRQFERRRVRKTYWALIEGTIDPPEGTWTDHVWKVYGRPQARVVEANHPGAQLAILRYRTLGETPQGSWLEIELETGRTHQVRVQAASRGCPILGDALYGSTTSFGPPVEDERQRQIALHARLLGFEHPDTRQRVELTAGVDAAWRALGIG
jgi:23S rRNA pseudouridine1911/1915/1917 synthase